MVVVVVVVKSLLGVYVMVVMCGVVCRYGVLCGNSVGGFVYVCGGYICGGGKIFVAAYAVVMLCGVVCVLLWCFMW